MPHSVHTLAPSGAASKAGLMSRSESSMSPRSEPRSGAAGGVPWVTRDEARRRFHDPVPLPATARRERSSRDELLPSDGSPTRRMIAETVSAPVMPVSRCCDLELGRHEQDQPVATALCVGSPHEVTQPTGKHRERHVLVPHPDDEPDVRAALEQAERGEVLSPEETELYLRSGRPHHYSCDGRAQAFVRVQRARVLIAISDASLPS